MNFPLEIISRPTSKELEVWETVYKPSAGTTYDKTIEESLWRRMQAPENQLLSYWQSPNDLRRKLFYYQHQYALFQKEGGDYFIGLKATCIISILSLPDDEVSKYYLGLHEELTKNGWTLKQDADKSFSAILGDLVCEVTCFRPATANNYDFSVLPGSYSTIEIIIRSASFKSTEDLRLKVWTVLRSGMRTKLTPGKPLVETNPENIIPYLPAQLEIGCGPAFEAGIPALHDLHGLYSINDYVTKKFILDFESDSFLLELIKNPLTCFTKVTDLFKRTISAPLTEFYFAIKELYQLKALVGPVITNNFDGLHLRLGIPEHFIRRYEDNVINPQVSFDKRARSLLVIGCHADRRGIQVQARKAGLKVIVVDPEGWYVNDKFIPYPLEAQSENDILFRTTATNFARNFLSICRRTS